jgi:hypothetical protein
MLSSAENDLVRRDSAVPGLALVLNSDAFAAALRRGAPQADLRSAQIVYARFKPHHYCRVTYRLDVAGAALDVDVRAGRREDLATWLADDQEVILPGPLGPGRVVLEDCAVVIHVFPNDLKLRGLRVLADQRERERVFRELFPDSPELWRGELRCLRYRPERRYVSALSAAGENRAILKSYTRKAYLRARHNAEAFHSRGPLRVARVLGRSDSHRLLAFEWLPGRLLKEFCVAPRLNCAAISASGAALAELHGQAVDGLNPWTGATAAAEVLVLASEVGFIHPTVARRCDDLARRLAAQLNGLPAMQCPVHGDFSTNQVLVDEPEVAIIDLDWAGYGDPADDVGNCIAQAERFALRGEMTSHQVELFREALIEGYSRSADRPPPRRIGLYTALQLFRRARFPFRTREPDWPQRIESLVDRAEAIFTDWNRDARSQRSCAKL